MWPYWFLFLVLTFQSMATPRQVPLLLVAHWSAQWRRVFVLLALMIGLRHEVGGDWGNYLGHIEMAASETLAETFVHRDPVFAFLNWFAAQSGQGIYLINSVFAALLTWGLLAFCRDQPRPWLALGKRPIKSY